MSRVYILKPPPMTFLFFVYLAPPNRLSQNGEVLLREPHLCTTTTHRIPPELRRSSEGMKIVTPPAGPRGTILILDTIS